MQNGGDGLERFLQSMSDEMHRRQKRWKPSPGLGKAGLGRTFLATTVTPIAAVKHRDWVDRIARRFGVRALGRGFAKAKLTDLGINEVIRRKNWIATVEPRYDRRRWTTNVFKNVILQQVFVARPTVAKRIERSLAPDSRSRMKHKFAQESNSRSAATGVTNVKRVLRGVAIVRRTDQVQSIELPLVLAGTRMNRRTGAGSTAVTEEDAVIRIEMPAAKLARRHRRVEVSRERASKEFGQRSAMQGLESSTLEMERAVASRPIRQQRSSQEEEPSEPAARPVSGMNVTQVADEVMKQLDRKLIAARERMGKI
jgi:hypothetical protein